MARIRVPTLVIGIWSDILYPSYQQRQIKEVLSRHGTPAEYVEIDSPHGHDSFLLDIDQVGAATHRFLDRVEKENGALG
jgi:homoserine O-acetyltransferase